MRSPNTHFYFDGSLSVIYCSLKYLQLTHSTLMFVLVKMWTTRTTSERTFNRRRPSVGLNNSKSPPFNFWTLPRQDSLNERNFKIIKGTGKNWISGEWRGCPRRKLPKTSQLRRAHWWKHNLINWASPRCSWFWWALIWEPVAKARRRNHRRCTSGNDVEVQRWPLLMSKIHNFRGQLDLEQHNCFSLAEKKREKKSDF